MKISILYVSSTGNTEKMAESIGEGLRQSGDVDVRLMKINGDEPLDAGFITDSSAVLVGTPAYSATMSWQLKKWFDTDRSVKLGGKLGGAFATARYVHGGGDMAVQDVLHHLLCKGMAVYSSGNAFGHPVIHVGPVAIEGKLEESRDLFIEYGKRFGQKALELFGK
jgi:NAD(P)H dehydrogenase (quinone)